MSLNFKFGKGSGSSREFEVSLGGVLSVKIKKGMEKATLKEIADAIAKKYDVIDGEVTLDGVGFSYCKAQNDTD